MNDRRDELVRRAVELRAESAALIVVSEELAGRREERKQAGDQAMEQPEEQEPYAGIRGACPASPGLGRASALPASSASRGPGAPGGENAGEAPVPQPGAGLLDEDEALVLAGLLEELAARHRPDPLSGPVLRAAALLRRRVAAGQQRGTGRRRDSGQRRGGSAVRREAGDTRDDAADHRDDQAVQRDRLAGDRNDRAKERDLQADAADEQARATEQRIRDRLGDAELCGQAAAGADRARDCEDREAMREMLAQARVSRLAARQDRYAAGQDRVAADRDRGSAQADRLAAGHDRQVARADRDQAVIENEEDSRSWTDPERRRLRVHPP